MPVSANLRDCYTTRFGLVSEFLGIGCDLGESQTRPQVLKGRCDR